MLKVLSKLVLFNFVLIILIGDSYSSSENEFYDIKPKNILMIPEILNNTLSFIEESLHPRVLRNLERTSKGVSLSSNIVYNNILRSFIYDRNGVFYIEKYDFLFKYKYIKKFFNDEISKRKIFSIEKGTEIDCFFNNRYKLKKNNCFSLYKKYLYKPEKYSRKFQKIIHQHMLSNIEVYMDRKINKIDIVSYLSKQVKNFNENRLYIQFPFKIDDLKKSAKNIYIVVSDEEMSNVNNKKILEEILLIFPSYTLILDIESSFINSKRELNLACSQIPNRLKYLSLSNIKGNAIKIGDNFLSSSRFLTHVDINNFQNLRSIGSGFLSCTERLSQLDLRGCNNVRKIGNGFLFYAQEMKTFRSIGLNNLRSMGDYFFSFSKSLLRFDCRFLVNAVSIGNNFLSNSEQLKEFNSKGFHRLKRIGNHFCSSSKSLEFFCGNGFKNVTSIGHHFLSNSKKLRKFNSNGFHNVKEIKDFFFLTRMN